MAEKGISYSRHSPGGGAAIRKAKWLPQLYSVDSSSMHVPPGSPGATVRAIGKVTSSGTSLFIQNDTPLTALAS